MCDQLVKLSSRIKHNKIFCISKRSHPFDLDANAEICIF